MDYKSISELFVEKTEPGKKVGVETNMCNVVSKETLRGVQLRVLKQLSEYVSHTFGPMGTNTKIISGNDAQTIVSQYSKDGHKVLKHVLYSNPIEMSIQAEFVDITHHVEHEVGDGTTSAVILAEKMFNYLSTYLDKHPEIKPYEFSRLFADIVSKIQNEILLHKRDPEIKDIYDICMISTNGNEEVSRNIASIYEEFGLDVDIDISISTTKDNMIKIYDGVTITEGYSDPAYINNKKNGTAELYNPHIYAFLDPIDTIEMISLFEKIVTNNIIDPLNSNSDMIPTVILSPKMTRDMSSLMEQIIEVMYQAEGTQKPPLLVITDISGSDEGIYYDIAKLCGCKYIKKYIDPKIKDADTKKGIAANLENVSSFFGTCEMVVADMNKTKFVNPDKMFIKDENGTRTEEHSTDYNELINFLQSEVENARANGADSREVGFLKKRLKSLQSNMVEYLVGGITIADRDADKDLIEDAVKNCMSACEHGIGRAANFEGLMASYHVMSHTKNDTQKEIAKIIFVSYKETVEQLYSTVIPFTKMNGVLAESLKAEKPVDLRTGEISDSVISSIMSDIKILEAICKLVTIMVTCNQCILQAPRLNTY
ncbi:MAG: hypothetical protein NC548_34825 [Lachnospiraceae bacterium]|nr:hypothetical protein [Lachnospiraceae bacterium]